MVQFPRQPIKLSVDRCSYIHFLGGLIANIFPLALTQSKAEPDGNIICSAGIWHEPKHWHISIRE